MKANGSLKAVLIMLVLSGTALVYLYLHATSIKLTRELGKVETEWRLVEEQVGTMMIELEHMRKFTRLESLWLENFKGATVVSLRTERSEGESTELYPIPVKEKSEGEAVAVNYPQEQPGR